MPRAWRSTARAHVWSPSRTVFAAMRRPPSASYSCKVVLLHAAIVADVALSAATIATYDCVLISTAHSIVDYALLAKHAKLVIDTRDAMRAFDVDMGARLVRA